MGLEQRVLHDLVVGERFVWSIRKILLLAGSVLVGIALVASPQAHLAILGLGSLSVLGVLGAGLLFAYGLTEVPAIAALFLLAQQLPAGEVALLGAVGATIGDALLFHVARKSLARQAGFLRRLFRLHPHLSTRSTRAVRALSPVIAGLILATPVPDEVAAAIFGSIRYDWRKFVVLSFAVKFFAILVIASAARLV